MYLPPFIVPVWLGALGWAATAASLAVAALRLRHRTINIWTVAGAVALVTALRLLEFPLHAKLGLGGSVLAVGFAVVVFGPEVAAWALAAATAATGLVAPPPVNVWAMGGNLLAHAAFAPWLVAWGYRGLKRTRPSATAGYLLAFAAGAAGPPVIALLLLGEIAALLGGVPPRALTAAVVAALTLTVAEGALATWGYTLTLSRSGAADGAFRVWAPSRRTALLMLAGGFVIAAAVAPLAPPQTGPFGPMRALARLAALPFGVHALAGAATVAASTAPPTVFFIIWNAARRRRLTAE